jgi:hypothetical protein
VPFARSFAFGFAWHGQCLTQFVLATYTTQVVKQTRPEHVRMKTLTNQVAELTCRWGKPCTWSVKPKMVAAAPTNVEPMSQAELRSMRKAHNVATLRALLVAA